MTNLTYDIFDFDGTLCFSDGKAACFGAFKGVPEGTDRTTLIEDLGLSSTEVQTLNECVFDAVAKSQMNMKLIEYVRRNNRLNVLFSRNPYGELLKYLEFHNLVDCFHLVFACQRTGKPEFARQHLLALSGDGFFFGDSNEDRMAAEVLGKRYITVCR